MADMKHPLGRWQAWNPHEAATFFAALHVPWWIAGGWAIDLFLERQTREHEDIDILILRRDQLVVRSLFGTWDMQAALPAPRDEAWPFRPLQGRVGAHALCLPAPRDEAWPFRPWHLGENLDETNHDIWCRPNSTQPWAIQLMIDDTREEQWLFRRMPTISRPVATIGGTTFEGIPYLAPEIQLLYKAKGRRPKDEADFMHTLPVLNRERRIWLRESLAQVQPHHPWLEHLMDSCESRCAFATG